MGSVLTDKLYNDTARNEKDITRDDYQEHEEYVDQQGFGKKYRKFDTGRDTRSSSFQGIVSRGTGSFTGDGREFESVPTFSGKDGVTLNLLDVSITEAAKIILGDILKVNYIVSDKIAGKVTIQTTSPVAKDALFDIFVSVLNGNGATIVASEELYRVIPNSSAKQSMASISRGRTGPGLQTVIVSLRYIGAGEVKKIIEQTGSASSFLRVDRTRNIILLKGTGTELRNILELISIFDVDWMKGMSIALYTLDTGNPVAIVKELETLFGVDKDGPLKGVIKFIPNRRLNSVLVMTSRPEYLDKAKRWIVSLDKVAQRGEQQLFVYKIQHRRAKELAYLLRQVLGGTADSNSNSLSANVAPRFEVARAESNSSTRSQITPPVAGDEPNANSASISLHNGGPTSRKGPDGSFQNVHVVADEAKNALLIMALPKNHERLLRILQRLDVVQTQVLLEAVIAEVSLNDELKFGLRWYFQKQRSSYKFSNAVNGAISSVFPGFSYFFAASDIQVALNAVSGITNVQVISAPSLMVQDNKTATLQVGDQVPITTQTAQSVTTPGAPVVNTVSLRDTGIILKMTPRVNDSGHVVLDIEQEVSNVVQTTTSGIDSPTIQQRKIQTSVVVDDGQVLALGGLIQERNTTNRTQVPILGDIPILGTAFRSKQDVINRTELLIFIRPQVVRNADEARQVTDEFRSQIQLQTPTSKRGRNRYHRDLNRITR